MIFWCELAETAVGAWMQYDCIQALEKRWSSVESRLNRSMKWLKWLKWLKILDVRRPTSPLTQFQLHFWGLLVRLGFISFVILEVARDFYQHYQPSKVRTYRHGQVAQAQGKAFTWSSQCFAATSEPCHYSNNRQTLGIPCAAITLFHLVLSDTFEKTTWRWP